MNQYEVVITGCKRLEQLLEGRFGAAGRGLHEKVTSVTRHLPLPVINKLRYIASVRNQVVHGTAELTSEELGDYSQGCQWAEVAIEQLPHQDSSADRRPLPERPTSDDTQWHRILSAPENVSLLSPLWEETSLEISQSLVAPGNPETASTPARPRWEDDVGAPPVRVARSQRSTLTLRLGPLLVAVAIPVLVACGVFFLHRTVAQHLATDPRESSVIVTSGSAESQPAAGLPVIAPGPPGIHRSLTQRR